MAVRKPLVIIDGHIEELSGSDTSSGLPQASPAGANTYVQYHDLSGSNQSIMGGDANFVWDKTNKNLSISTQSDGLRVNNNKVWNAGNDGSGSGLDADKLDSLQASSFVRTDASSTINGFNLTISDSNNTAGILNTRELVSTGKARALTVLQIENGASSQPSSGGELSLSNTSNNPFASFHKTDGTRIGFIQSDFGNTKMVIGQEQNNSTLVFRTLVGGSATDREIIHEGNHTTIINAEGNALALAIALG